MTAASVPPTLRGMNLLGNPAWNKGRHSPTKSAADSGCRVYFRGTDHSPALKDLSAPLLPALRDLRDVSVEIAIAAGLEAQRADVASKISPEELRRSVIANQWMPLYPAT